MILKFFPHLFFFFFSVIFGIKSYSQQVEIKVEDGKKNVLAAAEIAVKPVGDSIVSYYFTDYDGKAKINEISSGLYFVTITYLGYESFTDSIDIKSGQNNFSFQLSEAMNLIEEVKIVGKRPLLRQDGDKMIVDPEPLVAFSTNTLEVLEATPGLIVDPDNGIFLNNASPATIFINGREQRLGSQDLINILRSLPPGNIKQIEIIRSPSSKFNASSTGGIINIVLKKGIKLGRYGSVNAGFNQGKEGNLFTGFVLNDTGSKSGYSVQANYNKDGAFEELNSFRRIDDISLLTQNVNTTRNNHYGSLSLGYDAEWKNNLTFSYFGTFSANNNNSLSKQNNETIREAIPEFFVENVIKNDNPFYSHRHDFGLIKKLDTVGSDIDAKLNIGQSFFRGKQDYIYNFSIPVSEKISGNGDFNNNRNFFELQVDVTKVWKKIGKLETGIKSDLQQFDSKVNYFLKYNGNTISDSSRNNSYSYRDNINAGYLQLSKDVFWGITVKSGVRMENTNMKGNQTVPGDTSFTIQRFDWFPYMFISRDIIKIAGYPLKGFLIYRKSLNRPSYQNLNPGIRILDPFNYSSGNPALTPQFTDNYEFNISFDENPIFAIGRNNTKGIISNVLYRDPENEALTLNTYDNIGKSKETYFRLVGAIPPGGKYFFVAGSQYNHTVYEGLYNGLPVSFSRGSWRFFTFHSLKLTKNTRIMMNGFLLVNGQQNLTELKNFGQLNFTINQTFLDNKLNITVFVRDVLRTMENKFLLDQAGIVFEGERYNDNQRVGMSVRYSFGLPSKKQNKKGMFDNMDE